MAKKVILTGLRANNDLHIGNYFGALLPLIDMAKKHAGKYQINIFVPDLHSFTTPIDHSKLQEQIMHNLRIFVAAGLPLNNPDVHIYRQSYIPAHTELTWILNCFTPVGEMRRMTQFKDKIGVNAIDISKSVFKLIEVDPTIGKYVKLIEEADSDKQKSTYQNILYEYVTLAAAMGLGDRVSVGLFDYPVLMASDILLYGAELVPVGDDQTQHLEFTRDIAQRLNTKFNQTIFTIPLEVKKQHTFFGKDQGLRIKDLSDPTKKMSKSDESDKGVIFLGDEPKLAAKKILSATTDSIGKINYDLEKQPGISNLLQILALLEGKGLETVVATYQGQTQYGNLKKAVAEAVEAFLTDFQSKLAHVDEKALRVKLQASEAKMNEIANQTLLRVQKAVGLR